MFVNNINRIFLGDEEIVKAYLGSEQVYPIEPFHARFDLSQGESSTTLSLPIPSDSNLRIDWGDGTETTSGNSHTYETIGEYDVKIYGQIRGFRYDNANDPQKLMRIINWGQFIITTDAVFYGCSNLIIEALETQVNVETNNIQRLFQNCSALASIPDLDTSNVTFMSSMFYGCKELTTIPPLNTSNVTGMNHMFNGCTALTTIPPLNTSKVTRIGMSSMFYFCSSLDVDLTGWCVPLILSLPSNFVGGALLMTAEKLPVWGTCP